MKTFNDILAKAIAEYETLPKSEKLALAQQIDRLEPKLREIDNMDGMDRVLAMRKLSGR